MLLLPRFPLSHEFPIPVWLHKAGFKTGRTKFHSWEGKKERRRPKTVRRGRISRFVRMYIYIGQTFGQIEGRSLKLGGTERERERVRDRFSNGVKLPSLLTWMIIGRENFIESTYFFLSFSSSFSSFHFPRWHEAVIKAKHTIRNWSKEKVVITDLYGYKSFPPRGRILSRTCIAIVAFSSLSGNIPGNPNLCFSRYNLLILRM